MNGHVGKAALGYPAEPRLIENVRGYGYRYVAPAVSQRAVS